MAANRVLRSAGIALLMALCLAGFYWTANAQSPPPQPLELGSRLYNENCAVCHGAQGEGRVGATLAKDWPSIRPDLTVKTIIENGVSGSVMPAWSQSNGGPFSPAEIDALVAYILSWQSGGFPQISPMPTATRIPPITPIPEIVGDPNRGAVLFAENCAMCHGPDGEGRVGAALAQSWPGIRPDLNIRSTIASGISGTLMPAWSQADGGPLTDEQIDDLVAFLLALKNTSPVVLVTAAAPPIPGGALGALSGWPGVILFLVLLAVLAGGALLLQRRKA